MKKKVKIEKLNIRSFVTQKGSKFGAVKANGGWGFACSQGKSGCTYYTSPCYP